jgi:hypothetical protein
MEEAGDIEQPQNDIEAPLIQEPVNQLFCEICYVEHDPGNFVTNPACGHQFCKDSYKDFLTYEIT